MSTLNITISDKAAELVKNTMAEIETEDPHLFIYVAGGGCSGLQYGMAVSEGEPEIDDIVVYNNDIKIVVDGKEACSVAGKLFTEPLDAPLNLGSISDHIQAKVAKPTYIASGVRSNEIGLFSKEKPECIGA